MFKAVSSVILFLAPATALFLAEQTFATPAAFEAELGVLGSGSAVNGSVRPVCITITTGTGASNPINLSRVATCRVTYLAAGACDPCAHASGRPGGRNDHNVFYGNGFEGKNPINDSNWIVVDGLTSESFSNRRDMAMHVVSLTRLWPNMWSIPRECFILECQRSLN